MRFTLLIGLLACLASPALGQNAPPTWSLWLGGRALRFSAFATSQAADAAEQPQVRPTRRIGFEAGVARQFGAWQAGVHLGYAPGAAELRQGSIALTDELVTMTRYRIAASVGRRLTGVDRGQLRLVAGPTVDYWTFVGDGRAALGGEVALALDIPIGGVTLRQSLSLGIGTSPVAQESAGPDIETKGMTTLGFGMALALGL